MNNLEKSSVVGLVEGIGQMLDSIAAAIGQIDAELKLLADQIAAVKSEEWSALYGLDSSKQHAEKKLTDARQAVQQYILNGDEQARLATAAEIQSLLLGQENYEADKKAIQKICEAKLAEVYSRLPDLEKLVHFPNHQALLVQLNGKLQDLPRNVKAIRLIK